MKLGWTIVSYCCRILKIKKGLNLSLIKKSKPLSRSSKNVLISEDYRVVKEDSKIFEERKKSVEKESVKVELEDKISQRNTKKLLDRIYAEKLDVCGIF